MKTQFIMCVNFLGTQKHHEDLCTTLEILLKWVA